MPFNRFTRYCVSREEGGWGYSTNVHTGRLHSEVQPLTLLYTIFHEKSTPFVYVLDNWYSFHIRCIELCIAFNVCKCTVI